jgi:hypothetical protein
MYITLNDAIETVTVILMRVTLINNLLHFMFQSNDKYVNTIRIIDMIHFQSIGLIIQMDATMGNQRFLLFDVVH